mmetsp:Transcript_3251/g.9934  ORF Transcript_3251/g.9934 Transcript_3251/m.9934 type:complete len:369 (-) Transcript_3251:105-1211(-)
MEKNDAPAAALEAVLVKSTDLRGEAESVHGYDFAEAGRCGGAVDYDALFRSYTTTGFQATNFGRAIDVVNRMIAWRPDEKSIQDESCSKDDRCKIFLGYTSNLISSGVRESIRYLVQHRMVDVLVTTAGGVEEDLIKCLGPTYLGEFSLEGKSLRRQGLNRIGNLLVPNDNYCKFEDWLMPRLDAMLEEQQKSGKLWTPSRTAEFLGREINDESSVCYWAAKNDIPIFCPALTDGSLGDMLFFHSYRNPGLVIDLVQDIRAINRQALSAKRSGMIILGGGVVKHHICNANLMRNGADYAVYMNTANEFDGSDAGAAPDEAVSWGKIRSDGEKVKVSADASLMFPILVSQTFAKAHNSFADARKPSTEN